MAFSTTAFSSRKSFAGGSAERSHATSNSSFRTRTRPVFRVSTCRSQRRLQLRRRYILRPFIRSVPRLHAPYTLQGAVSVERQVTKSATLSVTYLNSRGFDQFLTINANAPYPGTPCYPNCSDPYAQRLPLRLGGQFQAEPADGEYQRPHRIQDAALRLLLSELCEQRYRRHLQLPVEFLRHPPGLRPRGI